MSRFGIASLENIDKEVDSITPANSKRSKNSVWGQFQCFCKERNYKFEKSSSKDELANMLKDWGFNMKRKDGEDYKESVVKITWNFTAKQLQEFYYKEHNVKFDPFADVEFSSARAARDAKRRNLQTDPKKRKLSSAAISKQEMERMVEMCDENTPTGLQKKFFLIAGYELAWRGEAGASCLHHFSEEKNNEGRIEYNPVFTKTCQGGAKKLADSKWLITNANSPEICPVR
ncbi:hypothetical protein GEV33_009853 [Tenebrio molitor]|uniref:Uncharacterized protein n=1 Tax=Tenebrio molitor TaxID=7067 RepID=A0A8J6HEG7_TENMO|nr:hypothetical protein GEV33_009853 [Tenebrio molitor]